MTSAAQTACQDNFFGIHSFRLKPLGIPMHCFYSNRVEVLYERLVSSLFQSDASRPFSKRLILVASPAMRSWLQLRMARDPKFGICAGVEIGMVESALEKIGKKALAKSVPQKNKFTLGVELVLQELLQDKNFNVPFLLKVKSKQLHFFAGQAAELFYRYSVYGEKLVRSWKSLSDQKWQKILWDKVHEKFDWAARFELMGALQHLPYDSVHFFSVSFLPQIYLDCLERLSQKLPIFGYILSPCRAFWCDILGDKQQSYYLTAVQEQGASIAQQKALEDLLIDTNPLLANFGRLGREMASQLEKLDDHAEQAYVVPSSIAEIEGYKEYLDDQVYFDEKEAPLNLLSALQTDLTLLRPSKGSQIEMFEKDGHSIEFHAAPTRWREVEVLYNIILNEIVRTQNTEHPLNPSDIMIMAPDIGLYLPYIKAVFEEKEGQIPIQVMDVRMPSTNTYIQAFLALVALGKSSWENKNILDLLDYAPIVKKQGWSADDVTKLKRWVRSSVVHWGFNVKHRDEYLASTYLPEKALDRSEIGTWTESLKRLCDSLLISSEDNPVYLEVSDAGLLGEWWKFLFGLKEDLHLIALDESRTTGIWVSYLNVLANQYLYSEHDEELIQGALVLEQALKDLQLESLSQISFDVLESNLSATLDHVTTTYREGNLQAVRFCSLLPMRAVPSRVIALIGMEAEMFPKKCHEPSGMDLMKSTGMGDYCPRQVDFDRYLFLEALLSARDKLILTFPGHWHSSKHSEEKIPSHLLDELIEYLDRAYCLNGSSPSSLIVHQHPLQSYHYDYFNGKFESNYLPSRLSWAKAAYRQDIEEKKGFFGNFTLKTESAACSRDKVELKTLKSLAKNPLQEYLKSILKMDLEKAVATKRVEDEPIEVARKEQGSMRSSSLAKEMTSIIHDATVQGKMPFTPIKEVYVQKLYADDAKLSQLASAKVDTKKTVTFVLSSHFQEHEVIEEAFQFPPLTIPNPQGGFWQIEGEIPLVSSEGLIVYAENQWEKLVKIWPQFLVLKCLIDEYHLPVNPAILPLHTKISKMQSHDLSSLDAKSSLIRFLQYYQVTRLHPSPLLPDWLPTIMEGDKKKLQKELEKEPEDKFAFIDSTAEWLFKNKTFPDASEIIQNWQFIAEEIYGELKKSISNTAGGKHEFT